MLRGIIFFAILLVPRISFATGSTRSQIADQIISSDASKTWTFPATSQKFQGAADYVQDTFYCNGGTSFTLTSTPASTTNIVPHEDGTALIQGASYDYTVSGTTLTLTSACATGQRLMVYYSK